MASWTEKLSRMTQSAVSKSKDMAEITRMNIEISNFENSIRQQTAAIGQSVVENGLLQDVPDVQERLAQIAQLQEKIAANRAAVEALRGANLCPNCGATLAADVNFCPHCGASRAQAQAQAPAEPQPAEKPVCPACGTQLESDEQFCPNCGHHMA